MEHRPAISLLLFTRHHFVLAKRIDFLARVGGVGRGTVLGEKGYDRAIV